MLSVRWVPLAAIVFLLVACVPAEEAPLAAPTALPAEVLAPVAPAVPTVAASPTANPTPAPAPSPTASPTPPQRPKRRIAIDPGHGGPEDAFPHELPDGSIWWEGQNTGIGRELADGSMLWEKDLTLHLARLVAERLRRVGYEVILLRQTDEVVNAAAHDLNGDGQVDVADELQARVDAANASGVELLLSIHFNAQEDGSRRGTLTAYCGDRPFGDDNRRLAEVVHAHVRQALRSVGYEAHDEGIYDDVDLDPPGRHFLLLGPPSPRNPRASNMPGVIAELLFLTDNDEYQLAARQDTQKALADELARAILEFFGDQNEQGIGNMEYGVRAYRRSKQHVMALFAVPSQGAAATFLDQGG